VVSIGSDVEYCRCAVNCLNIVAVAEMCDVCLKVERQMMMQNVMREQQMSIQLARSRDLFQWWAAFYVVAAMAAVAG